MGRQQNATSSLHQALNQRLGQHAFVGSVYNVNLSTKLVQIFRPGQSNPDAQGYPTTIADLTTLHVGDNVAVLEMGGNWVILGRMNV